MRLRSRNIGVACAYKPILEEKSIRLMHLEPALHVDAPLHFTFTTDRIENLLAQYEAISYTWGEPKLEYSLYSDSADGACVMVTRNLDAALRWLRHPTARRALWADAVCIDQSDDAEKSKQIPLMAEIFRGARRVLAWLDGGAEEERGMQILDQLSRRPKPAAYKLEDGDGDLLEQDNNMNLIHQFLRLAWFTRLWVIQEVIMNADVVLICGASEISWARLITILRTYRDLIEKPLDFLGRARLEGLYTVAELWAQDIDEKSAYNYTLLGLMSTFYTYACTDPRDRIFAVYSMALDTHATSKSPDQGYISMDVNYSSNVQQVYQDFAVACIRSADSATAIEILRAVLARNLAPTPDAWPSWVPDWRVGKTGSEVDLMSWAKKVAVSMVGLDMIAIRPRHSSKLTCIIDRIIPLIDTNDAVSYVFSLHAQLEALAHFAEGNLLYKIRKFTDEYVAPREVSRWWASICVMARQEKDEVDRWEDCSRSSSDRILDRQEMIDESFVSKARHLQAVMRSHRLFVATSPQQESPILGIGSGCMRKGDEVINFETWSRNDPYDYQETLVVRRTARTRVVRHEHINTHRLIGMAYLALSFRKSGQRLDNWKSWRMYLE
jgi:hypothetical protein